MFGRSDTKRTPIAPAAPIGLELTQVTATTTGRARRTARIAAAGAVALVLAATLASAAGAKPREDQFNDWCFDRGGQPFTIDNGPSQPDEYVCEFGQGDFYSEYGEDG